MGTCYTTSGDGCKARPAERILALPFDCAPVGVEWPSRRHIAMSPHFLATVFEKFRGKSASSLIDRWHRRSWERRLEQAAEEARRLAEAAKARSGGPGDPRR